MGAGIIRLMQHESPLEHVKKMCSVLYQAIGFAELSTSMAVVHEKHIGQALNSHFVRLPRSIGYLVHGCKVRFTFAIAFHTNLAREKVVRVIFQISGR